MADLIRSRGDEAIANDIDVSTPEGGSDLISHLTPESIAENYAKVESIEPFSEPVRSSQV